jgi:mitochondrial fission protein ELM1
MVDDSNSTGARAWVVLSDRAGDARQALAVADAIGAPYEVRYAIPRGGSARGHAAPRRFCPTLLVPERSSVLRPPWPVFVVAVGSWPIAVALWMREQTELPIVVVGRPPPGTFDAFAAIVAPSQYRIPDHASVVRMKLPPLQIDREAVERESQQRRTEFRALPRPLTAVFVGGPTKPFRFDRAVAASLAARLRRLADRDGGSLEVVTSGRTPADVVAALREGLPAWVRIHDWWKEPREENPYFALLGLADRFVVTGDSVSMLVEACSRGKPVAIAELPLDPGSQSLGVRLRSRLARRTLAEGSAASRLTLLLHRLRVANFTRDLRLVHRVLLEERLATSLSSESFVAPVGSLPDELDDVAGRIRSLLVRAGCTAVGCRVASLDRPEAVGE